MSHSLAEELQTLDYPLRGLAKACWLLLDAHEQQRLSEAEKELLQQARSVSISTSTISRVRQNIGEGKDPLGDAYCALVPGEQRRTSGQFYTPPELVSHMTTWALNTTPARVVDAGSGSGRFCVELRRQGFTGDLVAVDSDPLSCLMTRAHLAGALLEPADVRCESFLNLELPPAQGVTCWLGNPPFVRHHGLSSSVKQWARQAGVRLGIPVSGLAGLHALFYLAVGVHSAPGDTGCFVTSAEWADSGYGSCVRQLLVDQLGLRALSFLSPQAKAFDDATTTVLVACWDSSRTGDPVQVAHVEEASDLLAPPRAKVLACAVVSSEPKWGVLGKARARRMPGMTPLGSLVAVRRGIATGANGFFVIPDHEAEALGLSRYTHPVVCRAKEVIQAQGVLSKPSGKVLLILPDKELDENVANYVAHGETTGVHEGYLASARKTWYRLSTPSVPDAVATYMARGNPSFALNQVRACTLNTVHGLFLKDKVTVADLSAVLAWLNASSSPVGVGKTYAGGLIKFEPRDMEGILVPHPTSAVLDTYRANATGTAKT